MLREADPLQSAFCSADPLRTLREADRCATALRGGRRHAGLRPFR